MQYPLWAIYITIFINVSYIKKETSLDYVLSEKLPLFFNNLLAGKILILTGPPYMYSFNLFWKYETFLSYFRCESLAELIWLNRQQTKEVERLKSRLQVDYPPVVADVLPQLVQEFTQLLSTLVTSTFIIEKQPPQVMKTNTRYFIWCSFWVIFQLFLINSNFNFEISFLCFF